jgi:hypothetical protein
VEADGLLISPPQSLGRELHERQDGTLNIEGSVGYVIVHFPLAFPRVVFAGCLFDTPEVLQSSWLLDCLKPSAPV